MVFDPGDIRREEIDCVICSTQSRVEGYQVDNNVVYSSKYYVVWCPKYRRGVLVGPMAKPCGQRIKQIALRYRAENHRAQNHARPGTWVGGDRSTVGQPWAG